MTKFITKEAFKKMTKFDNPNGRDNLRFFDEENLIKLSVRDYCYWNQILRKDLQGFRKPEEIYFLDDSFKDYVENFKTAIKNKFLNDFCVLHEKDIYNVPTLQKLKLIRTLLYNNACAVHNNLIYGDYSPSNIMVDNNFLPTVIDLEMSIVNGNMHNFQTKYHNALYYYGTDFLEDEHKIITCDKITLLNLSLDLLLQGKVDIYAHKINPYLIRRNIKLLNLPPELEKKYIDILYYRKAPDKNDFFVDDFDYMIKNGYRLK